MFCVLVVSYFSYEFACCRKDYKYISTETYEEGIATVISYTFPDNKSNESGRLPKFYFKEKDEYRVLYAKNVEIENTYIVRYYPNTRFCEIVEEVGT